MKEAHLDKSTVIRAEAKNLLNLNSAKNVLSLQFKHYAHTDKPTKCLNANYAKGGKKLVKVV